MGLCIDHFINLEKKSASFSGVISKLFPGFNFCVWFQNRLHIWLEVNKNQKYMEHKVNFVLLADCFCHACSCNKSSSYLFSLPFLCRSIYCIGPKKDRKIKIQAFFYYPGSQLAWIKHAKQTAGEYHKRPWKCNYCILVAKLKYHNAISFWD